MEVLDGYIQLNALLNPAHPSLNYSRPPLFIIFGPVVLKMKKIGIKAQL